MVIEPGLHIANKWDTPALESVDDCIIRKPTVERYVSSIATEVAMEESRFIATELLRSFDVPHPLYAKW